MKESSIKRIKALEAKAESAEGIDEIHIMIVEGSPEGPRYTGEVHVWPLNGGAHYTEHRAEMAGQPASNKPMQREVEPKLTVVINKPGPMNDGCAQERT